MRAHQFPGVCLSLGLIWIGSTAVQAGFLVTGFEPDPWPRTDSALGVAGATIEDFEDVNLATGLQVSIQQISGSFGPSGVLPRTFDPRHMSHGGDDPLGEIFLSGLWDGTRVLINHKDNLVQGSDYNDFGGGDVTFHFSEGVSLFGVSMQQNSVGADVLINGVRFGHTGDWLTLQNDRNGYLRIDVTGGSVIHTVTFVNQQFSGSTIEDGFAFDHLAFVPAVSEVPEPSSVLLIGLASPGLVLLLRRNVTRASASSARAF